MDATHVKARANSKKMRKRIADEEALFFEEQLKKEINEDREAHGKKPLKEKKEDPKDPPSCGGSSDGKEEKRSRKVQRIRKADGSERVNIKMFLRIPCRQPVTKTDGFWVIV